MWIIQTIEGLFCILMGAVTVGFDGPDEPGFSAIRVQGIYVDSGTTYTVNGTLGEMGKCASKLIFAPATALVDGVETTFPGFENGAPDPIPLIKIYDLGIIIIVGSLSMLFIFFPGEGGIILPKTFPYNP